jgi:carboxylate-amine ligase
VKELGDVELILVAGASYQRQLRTAAANDGDLKAVVRALAGELRDGLQDPRS